jgi:hypothetical protein
MIETFCQTGGSEMKTVIKISFKIFITLSFLTATVYVFPSQALAGLWEFPGGEMRGQLPGDCNVDESVTIDEVMAAINTFLNPTPDNVPCRDFNDDGEFLIDEIMLVINSFLEIDRDEDDMVDSWEAVHGLDPSRNDADENPDGDEFVNLEEYQNGFNPLYYEPISREQLLRLRTLSKIEKYGFITWPSDSHINLKMVTQPRPPSETRSPEQKRIAHVSPSDAKTQSVEWGNQILQTRWIPDNLEDQMLTLGDDVEDKFETVRVRYRVGNIVIQITQTCWNIWLVIKREDLPEAVTDEQRLSLVRDTIRSFLNTEAYSISLGDNIGLGIVERYVDFLVGIASPIPPDGIRFIPWITDGRAVAIGISKEYPNSAYVPTPDDDWF